MPSVLHLTSSVWEGDLSSLLARVPLEQRDLPPAPHERHRAVLRSISIGIWLSMPSETTRIHNKQVNFFYWAILK